MKKEDLMKKEWGFGWWRHWIRESFTDTAPCSQRKRSSGLQMALGGLQLQGIVFYFSLVTKSAAVLKNDHRQNQCWTRPRYGEEKACSSTSAPLAHSPARQPAALGKRRRGEKELQPPEASLF